MQREDERELHERLLAQDPRAPSDLFQRYYEDLVHWLQRQFPNLAPSIDGDVYYQAAFQALTSYVTNPTQYQVHRRGLRGYLRMAARGDFLNVLRREQEQARRRVPLDDVAHRLAEGNREIEQAETWDAHETIARWRAEMTQEEVVVLELLVQGERRTAVFAAALGIATLPQEEQQRRVKQIKDRIKKRLRRKGTQRREAPVAPDKKP